MPSDPYELLGVAAERDRRRDQAGLPQARPRAAPRREPGDPAAEARFKEITGAYEVLRDPERRRRYDMFGDDGRGGGGGNPAPTRSGSATCSTRSSPGRLRRRRARRSAARPDAEAIMRARPRRGRVRHHPGRSSCCSRRSCDRCDGSGCRARHAPRALRPLRRSGRGAPGPPVDPRSARHRGAVRRVRGHRQRDPEPVHDVPRRRPRAAARASIEVEVPAGIDDGQRLRLTGRGPAAPRGGAPGDLYVTVRVRPHPTLERHGDDLVHQRRIAMTQAALGTVLTIDTLDGSRGAHRPARARSPARLPLPRRGVPVLHGRGRGDLLVQVDVDVPKELSHAGAGAARPVRRAARRGGRSAGGGRVLLARSARRSAIGDRRVTPSAAPAAAHVFVDALDGDGRRLGRRRRRPPPAARAPAARRRGGHRAPTARGQWRLCTHRRGRRGPARDSRRPVRPSTRAASSSPRVVVAFAPAKGDQAGAVVHQLVELGVDRVDAAHATARSVVRWDGERGAKRASTGSRASSARRRCSAAEPVFPELARSRDPRPSSPRRPGSRRRRAGSGRSAGQLTAPAGDEWLVVVGPEGGLRPGRAASCSAPRRGIAVGPHVLRAVTAPVAAAAALVSRRATVSGHASGLRRPRDGRLNVVQRTIVDKQRRLVG